MILLPIIFTIYTLVDCAGTDASEVRNLPKWGWLLIIILIGFLGSVGYWVAGRPVRSGFYRATTRRILPPDDDPEFLRKL